MSRTLQRTNARAPHHTSDMSDEAFAAHEAMFGRPLLRDSATEHLSALMERTDTGHRLVLPSERKPLSGYVNPFPDGLPDGGPYYIPKAGEYPLNSSPKYRHSPDQTITASADTVNNPDIGQSGSPRFERLRTGPYTTGFPEQAQQDIDLVANTYSVGVRAKSVTPSLTETDSIHVLYVTEHGEHSRVVPRSMSVAYLQYQLARLSGGPVETLRISIG